MNLKLVKASKEYRTQITEMLDEWYASGEKIIPYTIRRLDYRDFEYYCANLEVKDTSSGLVPDSTFFCLDEDRDIMVGAVNIRHYLNEALLQSGGHLMTVARLNYVYYFQMGLESTSIPASFLAIYSDIWK